MRKRSHRVVDGPIAKVLSVVRVPLFVDGPGLAPVELKLREDAPGKVVEHEEKLRSHSCANRRVRGSDR